MSVPEPRVAALAEQTEALTRYLEDLFAEKPMSLPAVLPTPPTPARVLDLPATRVVEAPAGVVQTPAAQPAVPATAATTESARPDWAQEPFPCLLLKVQGLALALPLVKLNRILPWSEPALIPGYVGWLRGVLRDDAHGRAIKVVDTAGFIMPERPLPNGGAPPRHIVLIGEGKWGLTCEDVSSVITIDPSKVRWRTSRTKRPWLAGTLVEHLCALLDAERLDEMLSTAAPGLPG